MSEQDAATLDRRSLLRAGAGGTAAALGGAAATGSAAAQSQEIMAGTGDAPLAFSPDSVTVEPGTTVTWSWGTDGHNIVVDSQPDGANWEGHTTVENTGFEYQHTFEVEGTYEYYCEPHLSAGMEGTIEVAAGGGGGGGGSSGPPKVSSSALNLSLGAMGTMASVVALVFYFIKYGGSDEE
ncbi:plastocyanin [Salinarchaeum sp. Harcht-Bsk1]|uniref:plastocyanin/azurin family copper-binding protein n=1 Tax=Salinarchaeum sp. Harcht-Bsk1 TaxID=1333523 RepID=UPI0003422B5D|nr:plastocyanin/azurin family copper-binding protein [Salinarchaeum sp. Harcht-Bsk1]AGN01108.1 plastocyanin [Salinarchaeum sp. Harcht-Bsk1]